MKIELKYIMFSMDGCTAEVPVIFPSLLQHQDVRASAFGEKCVPVSAGFVNIFSKNEVFVFGDSSSLKVKSRPEDADIIKESLA